MLVALRDERLATSWTAPAGMPPKSVRCQAPLDHPSTGDSGFDELAVDDDERAVGVPVVMQADGLPRRPAEQPDLIGRCRQQPDAGPLYGVVSHVRPPQVLGGGQST